jgi:hypothetical protein
MQHFSPLRTILFACALASTPLAAFADEPATAQPALEAFRDVPTNSFAYQAVQALEADRLITGYPNGTFKGNRPLTRYEAAVITQRVVQTIEEKLKDPATAGAVSGDDLKAVRTLLTEFKENIADLRTHVAQIDERLKTAEKTLDARQFHALYFLRAGSFTDRVSAYDKGVPLASGTVLAANSLLGSGEKIKRNTLVSGANAGGNGYQVLRLMYDGNIDPKISYHVQVENQLFFSNASASTNPTFGGAGVSGTIPAVGTYSTSGATGNPYPTNTTFRINYANVTYKNPSGLAVTAGRYSIANSGLGLNYNDYFNGALVTYTRKSLSAQAGYSFNYAALSNGSVGNASYGNSGQTLLAAANYQLGKKAVVGAAYSTDIAANEVLWNPALGYQSSDVPISVGSLYGKYAPGEKLVFEAEGLERFGNDPFTKARWQQHHALLAQAKYGTFNGAENGNYLEGGYLQAGFNALSGHTGIENTLSYYPQFITNVNGYRTAYLGLHHWLTKNARIGLVYLHYNLIPATDMPVQSASGACTKSTCYIGRDNASALFLQTWVQL